MISYEILLVLFFFVFQIVFIDIGGLVTWFEH